MHAHAGAATAGADAARDQIGPDVEVVAGIADHRRFTGGPRRGMKAQDLLARHGEHAEWIIVAQILLGRERKFGKVLERTEITGVHARGIEFVAVCRHIVIDARNRRLDARSLPRRNLVTRGALDWFYAVRRIRGQVELHSHPSTITLLAGRYRHGPAAKAGHQALGTAEGNGADVFDVLLLHQRKRRITPDDLLEKHLKLQPGSRAHRCKSAYPCRRRHAREHSAA